MPRSGRLWDYSRVPYCLYHDPEAYQREHERIFRGPIWNFLGLEAEIHTRKRRISASRIAAGSWLTRGMTRSIVAMLISPKFEPAGAMPRPLFHCPRPAQDG